MADGALANEASEPSDAFSGDEEEPDDAFKRAVLSAHASEATADEAELLHSLSSVIHHACVAPDSWRFPFAFDDWCSRVLLARTPASFWKRLARQFPNQREAIGRAAATLSDEDLLELAPPERQMINLPDNIDLELVEGSYSTGGIGRHVYAAATALATLLVTRRSEFSVRGKRVCELGCGVGLVGLAASRCGASSVVMTDSAEASVLCAAGNAKRNNLDGSSVRAAKLDWCNFGTEATAEAACAAAGFGIAGDDGIGADRWPDVLLGADCCYSETMGDSLLEAIAYLLSHAPEGSRCYIVNGWPNRGLRRFETLIGAREALQAEEARAKENGSEEVDDVHRPFVDDDDTTQSQEEHYGDDKVEDANTSSSRRRRSSPRGLETLKLISCERITGFASHAHHLYCIGSVARETAAAAPAESIVSSTPPRTPPSTPPKPKRTVAAVAAIDDDYNDTAPPTLCALVKAAEAEATRRALDAAGLLDLNSRAFRHQGNQVALPLLEPLSEPAKIDGQGMLVGWALGHNLWGGPSLQTAYLSAPGRRGAERVALRSAITRSLRGAPQGTIAILTSDDALPKRWERLGDVVLFAAKGVFDPKSKVSEALKGLSKEKREAFYTAVASSLNAQRLGVQGIIEESLHRKSTSKIVWPFGCHDGWTVQRENGVLYGLDVTKNMFSSGNGTEKHRVARFDCSQEVVVDLYAGIGYFTLPYLVHARARHLHACEWDSDALIALQRNFIANEIDSSRYTIHPGDNRLVKEKLAGVAHRINLGLIPSSEDGWPIAMACIREEGGMMHVHANVGTSAEEEALWCSELIKKLNTIAVESGRGIEWTITVQHLERVKSYAPKVQHVVADVRLVRHAHKHGVHSPPAPASPSMQYRTVEVNVD